MYSFDPAINYGPNDVGASAFSIVLVCVGILVGIFLLGTIYNFITNAIKNQSDD